MMRRSARSRVINQGGVGIREQGQRPRSAPRSTGPRRRRCWRTRHLRWRGQGMEEGNAAVVAVVVARQAVMTEVSCGARTWLQRSRDGGGEGGGRAGECHEGRRGEITRRGGGAIGGLGAGVRTEPRGGKIRVWRSLLLARARVHGSSPPPCNSLPGQARKARSILLRLLAGVRGGAHRASAGAASRHHR